MQYKQRPHDPWFVYAVEEIESSVYGLGRKTTFKAKALKKFGLTANADAGAKTTIMTLPGTERNETFSTTNDIDRLSSSSASDTGVIGVEGHRYDADNNLIFSFQTVTLTGQTPAVLATPLCRCTRLYVYPGTFAAPASDLVGTIYAFASPGVTVTAGVPQTASSVKCMIPAGYNQSQKGASAVSASDAYVITAATFSMDKIGGGGSTANVFCDVEWRQQGGVWRPLGMQVQLTPQEPTARIVNTPYDWIPPNSDFRATALSDTDNVAVYSRVAGQLVTVL